MSSGIKLSLTIQHGFYIESVLDLIAKHNGGGLRSRLTTHLRLFNSYIDAGWHVDHKYFRPAHARRGHIKRLLDHAAGDGTFR